MVIISEMISESGSVCRDVLNSLSVDVYQRAEVLLIHILVDQELGVVLL